MPYHYDRVKETTTTTGTGALTLNGAVAGFRSFSSVLTTAGVTTVGYCIEAVDGNGTPTGDWEVGLGILGATTFARNTVLASSNAGNLVNLSAGTKNVFLTYAADIGNKSRIGFQLASASGWAYP